MNLRNNLIELFFFLAVGTLFTLSLIMGIVSTTEFNYSIISIAIQIFFVLLVLKIFFWNKWTFLVATSILIVAAGMIIFEYFTASYYEYEYTTIAISRELIQQTFLYLSGFAAYNPTYELLITWTLIGSMSLFVFIFGSVVFNFFILFTFGAALYATILSSPFFDFYIAFYIFIAASTAFLIKYLNGKTLKNRSPFALYTIPITAIAMFIAINIPTPREGFAGEAADNLFVRPFNFINETLYDAFRPMYFSLSQTGFGSGDARRLGGNVTPNYSVVMRVSSDREVLYLTGAILDTYTGYSWLNTFAEEEPQLILEGDHLWNSNLNNDPAATIHERLSSLTFIYLTSDYSYHEFAENFFTFDIPYINENDVHLHILSPQTSFSTLLIDTHSHSTMSVFYNGILWNYIATEFNIQTNKIGTLTATERIPREYTYTIEHIDLDGINFSNLLQRSYRGLFEDLKDVLLNLESSVEDSPDIWIYPFTDWTAMNILYSNINNIIEQLDNYFVPRRDFINEHFTQLPEHFPQRVIDLAFHITDGAESNYERARMLEAYLRHHFTYTLTPGNLPHGVDFVEHFLFYLQQGYCVHYATAFVTMARALGMPTRYVEGFIAGGMGSGEFFYVRNRQGHAWAEVYFEGIGWHRFDPTPPSETFGVMFASPTNSESLEGGHSGLTHEEFLAFWEEFEYAPRNFNLGFDEEFYQDEDFIPTALLRSGEPVAHTGEEIQIADIGIDVAEIVLDSTLIVLVILAVLIILRISTVILKHYRNLKKPNNESVIYIFTQIVERLKFLDYEIRPNETALDFTKRIGRRFDFENKSLTMTDIANIYQKAMYSPHTLTEEERKICENTLKSIEKQIIRYTNKPKYFIKRYVLAK